MGNRSASITSESIIISSSSKVPVHWHSIPCTNYLFTCVCTCKTIQQIRTLEIQNKNKMTNYKIKQALQKKRREQKELPISFERLVISLICIDNI